MISIGAYNAFEPAVVTFDVFDKYYGLYFWSMQIAAWGIVLHLIAAMVRYVTQASGLAISIPFLIGWCAMVTGQALVLYSRLHLVVLNTQRVRWVLWMIVINAVMLHIPMSILFLGVGQGDRSLLCWARRCFRSNPADNLRHPRSDSVRNLRSTSSQNDDADDGNPESYRATRAHPPAHDQYSSFCS